ncbi:MAG: hypothetical protein ABW212_07385, partial [Pseudonocardia sediminis]
TNSDPGRDVPMGDITEHGADPEAREARATTGGHLGDGPAEETPGGDLTEHGADPTERDAD